MVLDRGLYLTLLCGLVRLGTEGIKVIKEFINWIIGRKKTGDRDFKNEIKIKRKTIRIEDIDLEHEIIKALKGGDLSFLRLCQIIGVDYRKNNHAVMSALTSLEERGLVIVNLEGRHISDEGTICLSPRLPLV